MQLSSKPGEGTLIEATLPAQRASNDGQGDDDGHTDMPRLQRHGLLGMRYRVEAEGGTMRLSSKPGEGTLIEATLPAHHASNVGPDDPDDLGAMPVAAAA